MFPWLTCIRSSCSRVRRWPQAPPPRRRRERELQRPEKIPCELFKSSRCKCNESYFNCSTELTRYFMLVGRRVSTKCAAGWKSGGLYTNLACDALLRMLPMCCGAEAVDCHVLLLLFLAPQSSFRTSGDKTPCFQNAAEAAAAALFPSWDREGIRGMDTTAKRTLTATMWRSFVAPMNMCSMDRHIVSDVVRSTVLDTYFTVRHAVHLALQRTS